ncbi:hypothetical protein C1645_697026 [Glomus cerebriforme]|uniref:YABBY protein C-terminal domain-containing protein n=1 Tax=Glomus cerebriforme TaxID=658196 RepID=A0A397STW0_9GLOM|nr:hypothetical protein C1645_697026 [Glomus cerebriforme]
MPYKKVLPKELYTDLLKTYLNLNPDSKPNVRSNPIIIDDDDDDFDDQNQESVEEPSRKRNTCDITVEKDKSDTVKRPGVLRGTYIFYTVYTIYTLLIFFNILYLFIKVKILRGRKRLSPYNSFVKTELPKIKAENPDLEHKAAFMRMVEMWKTSPDNPAVYIFTYKYFVTSNFVIISHVA